MKTIDKTGKIWTEPAKEAGYVNVGFTQKFINETLGECFHILPSDTQVVTQQGPLMAIETNDGLESLRSPISGKVIFFNHKARDFPDRLIEEDVIFSIKLPEEVSKLKTDNKFEGLKQAKKAKQENVNRFFFDAFDDEDF